MRQVLNRTIRAKFLAPFVAAKVEHINPRPYNPAGTIRRIQTGPRDSMIARKPIFPGVIELNFQAGELLGCNVYLVFDQSEWLLIDIGFDETVEEIIELVRQMDFPLGKCKMLIGTHA